MPVSKKRDSADPGSALLGQLAGEYRIVSKLGAGGFGAVYEAEHPLLKRRAAVKVLHANAGVDSVTVQRFIEEARSASQIRHRHIVDIFSFGTLPNGQYFYVMDLLEGAPLDRYLKEHGRFEPEVALPLLTPIAHAIDALHAAGIVHRDLKPGNIFLAWESSGEVVPKLLDFGLVKLLGAPSVHTATGVPMGTPYYMSPEQCQGEPVDGRADVYAFGVICYELLTGEPPFTGDSATAVLVAHVLQEPPRISQARPELSPDLDEPLLRMLSKDPRARPASAGAALHELERVAKLAGVTLASGLWLPQPARSTAPEATEELARPEQSGMRPGLAQPGAAPALRARYVWAAAALVLAALAAVVVIYLEAGAPASNGNRNRSALVASSPSTHAASGSAPGGAAASTATAQGAARIGAAQGSVAEGVQAGSGAAPAGMPRIGSQIEPRQVALTVRGAPPGAQVVLGDHKLGPADSALRLPHGERPLQLGIVAPGYERIELDVTPSAPLAVEIPVSKVKRRAPKRRALPADLENPF